MKLTPDVQDEEGVDRTRLRRGRERADEPLQRGCHARGDDQGSSG